MRAPPNCFVLIIVSLLRAKTALANDALLHAHHRAREAFAAGDFPLAAQQFQSAAEMSNQLVAEVRMTSGDDAAVYVTSELMTSGLATHFALINAAMALENAGDRSGAVATLHDASLQHPSSKAHEKMCQMIQRIVFNYGDRELVKTCQSAAIPISECNECRQLSLEYHQIVSSPLPRAESQAGLPDSTTVPPFWSPFNVFRGADGVVMVRQCELDFDR